MTKVQANNEELLTQKKKGKQIKKQRFDLVKESNFIGKLKKKKLLFNAKMFNSFSSSAGDGIFSRIPQLIIDVIGFFAGLFPAQDNDYDVPEYTPDRSKPLQPLSKRPEVLHSAVAFVNYERTLQMSLPLAATLLVLRRRRCLL